MTATSVQRAWVNRVLLDPGGTKKTTTAAAAATAEEEVSPEMAAFDAALREFRQTGATAQHALSKDFSALAKMLVRLPTIASAIVDSASLSALSNLNTTQDAEPANAAKGAMVTVFMDVAEKFKSAMASSLAAVHEDFLSQLAKLNIAATDDAGGGSLASVKQLQDTIVPDLLSMHADTAALVDGTQLSALAALRTA